MSSGRDGERDATAEAATSGDATPRTGATTKPAADDSTIDFYAFLQSLYVSALMALGEVENPETRRLETNLALARQNIDILVLLKAKTQGNLTPEETDFLTQIVTQLQLAFVERRRAR